MKKIFFLLFIFIVCITQSSLGQVFGQDSIGTGEYFPVRGAFGLEITRHFERGTINVDTSLDFNGQINDNYEFGINYLFTGWYGKNKPPEEKSDFVKTAGLYQIGTFLTANPLDQVIWGESEDFFFLDSLLGRPRLWKWSSGIIYNQFSTRLRGLGISLKVKATTYAYDQPGISNLPLFENLDITPQAGISWMGLINFYYARTFPVLGEEQTKFFRLQEHRLTLTVSLNHSIFKYGLQGL